jgi:Primosomal protein N'' (replication factor Y) - superfamily II helicase
MPAVLRVALPLPLPTLFDYLPPAAGQASVGSRVLVPFGRGKQVGVVVAIDVEAAVGSARLKQVLRLLDDTALLDTELMQTLAWAADYWLGAPGEAYANALPLALREAKPLPALGDEYWSLSVAGRSAHDAGSRRGGSKTLLALLADGALSAQELNERLPGGAMPRGGWQARACSNAANGRRWTVRGPPHRLRNSATSSNKPSPRSAPVSASTSRSCSTASPAAARPRYIWR